MNFEEQILEAAKSIAAATSALVKAASAAQRELVAQGKVRQDEAYNSPLSLWFYFQPCSFMEEIQFYVLNSNIVILIAGSI